MAHGQQDQAAATLLSISGCTISATQSTPVSGKEKLGV